MQTTIANLKKGDIAIYIPTFDQRQGCYFKGDRLPCEILKVPNGRSRYGGTFTIRLYYPLANVATVRRAIGKYLQDWNPDTELQSLRHRSLTLSYDADYVVDLHCDCESVMHFYTEQSCWPQLEPLTRFLQCHAVLLAKNSGSGPFDECLSGVWWQLADQ